MKSALRVGGWVGWGACLVIMGIGLWLAGLVLPLEAPHRQMIGAVTPYVIGGGVCLAIVGGIVRLARRG